MSVRRVGRARAEIELSQGSRGQIPLGLLRFQAAVGGHGYVTRPRRGYLYYWRAGRRAHIEAVIQVLWPRLDETKRAQIRASVHRDGTLAMLRPIVDGNAVPPRAHTLDTRELAWAAGFFSGDGTIGTARNRRLRPDYRRIMATLPQASAGSVPPALLRFRAAVLGLGTITGPHLRRDGWGRLPQYRWETWDFARTQAVIALLWPWLTEEKRAQARAALLAVRAPGRSSPGPNPRGDAAPARRAPSGRSTSSSRAASATRPRRAAGRAS